MSYKKKQIAKYCNPAVGITIGAGSTLVLSVAFCAAIAAMINSGSAPIKQLSTWIYALQAACCFLGAMTAAIIVKEKRFQVCLLTALTYFLCLMAMTALLFEGQYSGIITSALMVMLGGFAAGLLGIRTKKRGKIKAIKRPYR